MLTVINCVLFMADFTVAVYTFMVFQGNYSRPMEQYINNQKL